jgi:F-type H+-transporting ATPase subunit b
MKNKINYSIFALISFLADLAVATALTALPALAQAAEEGHGEEVTFVGDWLPRLVNFAIIAGVLIYFMRKPVRDFFKNRSAEIARSIEESRQARERAAAALAEMERKMKDLEAETGRMIEDAKARGEKDKQALAEEGKKVAADVQAQVKASIDIEVQKAKTALAAEAALLSIDLAEGNIKEKISKQDHERILKDYVKKVGGKG